jgi:hypothetical protein
MVSELKGEDVTGRRSVGRGGLAAREPELDRRSLFPVVPALPAAEKEVPALKDLLAVVGN